MTEYTETHFAVAFSYGVLLIIFLLAVWKRKVDGFGYLAGIGVIWNISLGAWGLLIRSQLANNDAIQADYGPVLRVFFQDGYFLFFHILLLCAFGYLARIRHQE